MNLLLLKRDPDAWRTQQSSESGGHIPPGGGPTKSLSTSAPEKLSEKPPADATPKHPSKRKRKEGNDIDQLFDSALGKKQKRGALPTARGEPATVTNSDEVSGLESVLGAIKDAPKGDKDRKHKKKKAR